MSASTESVKASTECFRLVVWLTDGLKSFDGWATGASPLRISLSSSAVIESEFNGFWSIEFGTKPILSVAPVLAFIVVIVADDRVVVL